MRPRIWRLRCTSDTKETIEGLSDEQVLLLLEQKWIVPLVEQLYALPQARWTTW